MTGRYLTDLADVCRRAGLVTLEQNGWQIRGRSAGGYGTGRPNHVMVHHTASGPSADGWPDANYCSYSSENRPVANLYLDRHGQVYVLAAGATNTNGAGRDPCGIVATDSMNSAAIGVEAGNNGVGEAWPAAQQGAYVTLVSALCDAYGIPTRQVHSHFEWAPTRKVDPAGPSQWSKPSGGGSSNMWRMDDFRASCSGAPAPGPGLEASDMLQMFTIPDARSSASTFVTNGVFYRVLADQDDISALTVMLSGAGMSYNVGTLNKAQLGAAGIYISPEGVIGATNVYL